MSTSAGSCLTSDRCGGESCDVLRVYVMGRGFRRREMCVSRVMMMLGVFIILAGF